MSFTYTLEHEDGSPAELDVLDRRPELEPPATPARRWSGACAWSPYSPAQSRTAIMSRLS
jgi:hypothetical protein